MTPLKQVLRFAAYFAVFEIAGAVTGWSPGTSIIITLAVAFLANLVIGLPTDGRNTAGSQGKKP